MKKAYIGPPGTTESEETDFGFIPALQPSTSKVEQLLRERLQLTADARCSASRFDYGAFDQMFKVETDSTTYILRVEHSNAPLGKTATAVATTRYLRESTKISLPTVELYDTSDQNLIGFEYVLEEFGPPQTLESVWKTLSMTEKERIVESLAEIQAELFSHRFQGTGNLHPKVDQSATESVPPHKSLSHTSLMPETSSRVDAQTELGPMVSTRYFWDNHGEAEPEPGPFNNSFQCLKRQLDVIISDQTQHVRNTGGNDVRMRATSTINFAQALLEILPKLFHSTVTSESSTPFHGNLSIHNILIKEDSKLPYIVDWECASTLPLWMACQLPRMLVSKTRTEDPRPKHYLHPLEGNRTYWVELLEYERGQLQRTFEDPMKALSKEWMSEYISGALKRDFVLAVRKCTDVYAWRHIQQWMNGFNHRQPIGLEELLYPGDWPYKGPLG